MKKWMIIWKYLNVLKNLIINKWGEQNNQKEAKEQRSGFLGILLGTLVANILGH